MQSNVTLNYGARWDVISPWDEKHNQLQTVVLGEQSRVYPGAPAGLVFPGDPGVPRILAPTKYDSFAPRIGISYSPDRQNGPLAEVFGGPGKTTLRAGYGLFYTAFEGLSAGIMSANPPYGYDYTSLAPPLFATPFVTAASGQSVGQRFPLTFPSFGASPTHPDSNVNWSQYLPITGVPAFFHENVPPYSESYMFSLQREIATNTAIQRQYVGTQAHHLLVLTSANPGNPTRCLSLSLPNEVMPGTPTCGPFWREWHLHHAFRRSHSGNARTLQLPVRRHHLPENHRKFELQRTSAQSPSQLRTTGVHGWLHVQQVSRPIFQSGGSGQSARSKFKQGRFCLRYASQFCGELQVCVAGE
jgi:hypothetical protein